MEAQKQLVCSDNTPTEEKGVHRQIGSPTAREKREGISTYVHMCVHRHVNKDEV